MKIEIRERRGKCRWCGCTEDRACGAGCSWANAAATLCSECVEVDKAIRTIAGRRRLAMLEHEQIKPGAIADALVEDLFQNGAGLKGSRLAIMASGIDHGGWSRVGFRDRVVKVLDRMGPMF